MLMMKAVLTATLLSAGVAFGGGELPERDFAPAPVQAAPRPAGRVISSGPLHRWTKMVGRNLPLPAPNHALGSGKELNEFYAPTYYYPYEHNNYEGVNPTYYPFISNAKNTNYKAPGNYCAGKLCGSSRSLWYWDSYDDWKRGERYEQHQ